MNVNRLELMVTMLKEVEAGAWKPSLTRAKQLISNDMYNEEVVGHNPTGKKIQETPVEFDLGTWVGAIPEYRNELSCGFTACAVGHATLDSRFNKMGLKPDCDLAPTYKTKVGWYALINFFELSEEALERLFSSSMYPEHLKDKALVIQVRRRIEKILEIGEKAFMETRLGGFYTADQYLVSPKGRIYKEYKHV